MEGKREISDCGLRISDCRLQIDERFKVQGKKGMERGESIANFEIINSGSSLLTSAFYGFRF